MKSKIKELLSKSAFWICPEDKELVQINIDRTADAIIKAKVFSSNAMLADSSPLSQQDKEDGMLLLNRLKHISIMQTDEEQVKRMLTLIDAGGFEIQRKR